MPYLQSAAIETISYDENTYVLCARFRDGGRTVFYEGVPQELYDELIFADSIGAFVRERVEGIYPAHELVAVRDNGPIPAPDRPLANR